MAKVKRDLIVRRGRIEGVIIAVTNSIGIKVTLGALASITARVKPTPSSTGKKRHAKSFLEADDFRGIDWTELDTKQREAILVAVAALSP